MVRRDKNHPSVFLWSLRNESGYGVNQDAAAGWVRSYDPTDLCTTKERSPRTGLPVAESQMCCVRCTRHLWPGFVSASI